MIAIEAQEMKTDGIDDRPHKQVAAVFNSNSI